MRRELKFNFSRCKRSSRFSSLASMMYCPRFLGHRIEAYAA